MPSRPSLYHKYPDYRVDLEPETKRVRLRYHGAVIADSTRTLTVRESGHDPVAYFPRDDVQLEHLERTDHRSFCPFKGDASYWTLSVGDDRDENAAWSYEDPFEEVAGLRDYVAFYPDRVDREDV